MQVQNLGWNLKFLDTKLCTIAKKKKKGKNIFIQIVPFSQDFF